MRNQEIDSKILEAWHEFNQLYPNEESALLALYRLSEKGSSYKHDDGFICPECKSIEVELVKRNRVLRCQRCKNEVWLTAGTFFARIRKAIPWLAAIWFIDRGLTISSICLEHLTGVTQSTAWMIIKKISLVVETEISESPCCAPVYNFASEIRKRSILTPAGQRPVTELDNSEHDEENLVETPDLSMRPGIEQSILENLSRDPIQFDRLCELVKRPVPDIVAALTYLELDDLIKSHSGDRYSLKSTAIKPKPKFSSNELTNESIDINQQKQSGEPDRQNSPSLALGKANLISSILEFTNHIFHGISWKYLQLYIAIYWVDQDKKRWQPGRLLKACGSSEHISSEQVRAYCSQAPIKLPF
ncbi:MAG TPA: hypothetical protein PKD05_07185 [Candidatus Melainabacteria bacterium]|nr:hypothetical protein [Candidatus Melainabacteria bacterium]HMP51325.1 hypothetical protein [Candidatus Melainabacteria bacterium]